MASMEENEDCEYEFDIHANNTLHCSELFLSYDFGTLHNPMYSLRSAFFAFSVIS
jgi:hypothetical protein